MNDRVLCGQQSETTSLNTTTKTMKYTITYEDSKAFHKGCVEFLKEGVTFEADHETLTIRLTGGY